MIRIHNFPFSILILLSSIGFFGGCGATSQLNVFSIEDDKALGLQVSQQIADDPQQFPILPENGNEAVYAYVRRLTTRILNTGLVAHADQFAWEIRIINDDETLNAFCTPGGYIYVYTGLIKYLDSEDQLAGVMAHEIAHAALRHSTRQMTRAYGISALYALISGKSEPGQAEQIAMGLLSLKFSRDHETEADLWSVKYLCPTDYNAAGAAGFFENMEGRSTPPEFLSTHPNPGNRVEHINTQRLSFGCRGEARNIPEYNKIKTGL